MQALLLAGVAAFGVAGATHAATITVAPSLAPNAFGSPSYSGYVTNATGALHDGQTSRGDPNSPSYYQAQSLVTAAQSIVTSFPSWMGQADPASIYGSAYASELGNRMLFGIKVNGDGTPFSIANLSFAANSSDPGNALGFSFAVGHYTYGAEFEGILAGPDGVLFTADDTYVTSGPATQLVDGLVGRGSGASLAAYCGNCTTQEQQQAIIEAASYFSSPTAFTGTYSLNGSQGSGTFEIVPAATAVPEPATLALLALPMSLAGLVARRRRRTSEAAAMASLHCPSTPSTSWDATLA